MPTGDAGGFKLGAVFVIDADFVEFICCHGGHSLLDCGHYNATEDKMATVENGTLKELNVQPGDVVQCVDPGCAHLSYKKGKNYTVGEDDEVGNDVEANEEYGTFRIVSRALGAPTGPVRTVTRKEIVPGEYGGVEVTHVDYATDAHGANVCIRIDNGFGPDSLRAAIATLTEIADALEESR